MRRLLVLLVYLISSSNTITHKGGSCGRDAIPHKIAIDLDGTPVLSCESPSCIGRHSSSRERAECEQEFTETVCVGEEEWTAGLIETTNGTHVTLRTLCCAFGGLARAKELQTVLLYANDSFVGGPIERHGRMIGFDLVKEVRKSVDDDGNIQYIISVFRMPCSERPKHKPRHGNLMRPSKSRELFDNYVQSRFGDPKINKEILTQKISLFPEDGEIPEFEKNPVPRQVQPVYSSEPNYNAPQQSAISGPEPLENPSAQVSGPEPPPAIPASLQPVPQGSTLPDTANYIAPSQTNLNGPIPPAPIQQYAAASSSYAAPNAYAQAQAQPAFNYPNSYATPQQAAAPQTTYSYQPVYYSTGMKCFSGEMTVQTPTGEKLIKDLEVGDQVLSIDENMVQYSPVIMFLHKKDDVPAEFYRVQLKGGQVIELTEDHLIYKTSCHWGAKLDLVHAKNLKIGECLDHTRGTNDLIMQRDEIVSIEIVHSQGIYAPLTATGDLFVNDILASCHTNYAVKSLQQTFFQVYRGLKAEYDRFFAFSKAREYDMPYGAEYLSSIIDLFVPNTFF